MAKSPTTTAANGPAPTHTLHVPADFTIESHGHTLGVAQLSKMSPKAIGYLIANGFNQSLTDAAAFTKKQKDGKSENEVMVMAEEARAKRFDAILAGEVGSRVGARGTPVESMMKDIAIERIRAIAASKGVPMPKKDVLAAAIEKVLAKQGEDIKAEATARLASSKAAAEAVGDLLG